MKVTLKRSGGIGGMTRLWSINADAFNPENARKLRELWKTDLQEIQLGIRSASCIQCRDLFCYEITLEDKGQKKSVQCTGEAIPEALRDCVNLILPKRH